MKKVAAMFIVAVLVPSLALGWLAIRSFRDQQFLIERQQSLLCQGVADSVAKDIQDALADYQREFVARVQALVPSGKPSDVAKDFDTQLRDSWALAEVGFVVTVAGDILTPTVYSRPEAKKFLTDNTRFLCNRESAEVYLSFKQFPAGNPLNSLANNSFSAKDSALEPSYDNTKNKGYKGQQARSVIPQKQQQEFSAQQKIIAPEDDKEQFSKIAPSEAEFRQLIGEETEGTIARFVDNRLNVLFWCRPTGDPKLVFGALVSLVALETRLRPLVEKVAPALQQDICVVLLDDNARPTALSRSNFKANWKRPFVASEIGEVLPHWEVAVYLLNPAKLQQTARNVKFTLGLLVGLLLAAISVGGWLLVSDLNRQLTLARQKTDFVSNVSHELKTPLTSIRMFSELLAQGRVADAHKQRSYLGIITAEAARLTRLINNVLDFARIERGEKKYSFQACELGALARETAEAYRPNFEGNGFRFDCTIPNEPVLVRGDRDALAQVIVNLLSNAEKYSDHRKEVTLQLNTQNLPSRQAVLRVCDRGLGVPLGCEEKIFEKFFRAHDSLSSGIQGSGLGLTLARQIARAHGGDLVYEANPGGGSCFSLQLPLADTQTNPS